jgi:SIR2-like domain
VNPDKTKFATTVLNETYYELIRRFANELEKENSVLFVHGFSFRDEHLRDLVLRAARTNPTLQVVIFCYSRADRTAYAKLLPEDEVKNGNVLYVQPAELEDHSSERSISLDILEADFFAPAIGDQLPQPDQRIELDIRTDVGGAYGV